jgi:hypothetical protein
MSRFRAVSTFDIPSLPFQFPSAVIPFHLSTHSHIKFNHFILSFLSTVIRDDQTSYRRFRSFPFFCSVDRRGKSSNCAKFEGKTIESPSVGLEIHIFLHFSPL